MEAIEQYVALLSSNQYFWSSIAAASAIGGLVLLNHLWKQSQGKIYRPPTLDFQRQAISVPNSEGYDIRASILSDSGGKIPETLDNAEDVKTVFDNFLRGLRQSNNGPCLGWRESDTSDYSWMTYGEVLVKALNFGSGLVKLGLKPGHEKTFVGIYAKNCPEWIITELGAISQSIAIIPLYDTLGTEAVSFILNQAKIQLVVCDSSAKAKRLADNAAGTPSLQKLVIFEDKIDEKLSETLTANNLEATTLKETLALGANGRISKHLPAPDDTFIICYTSGTTGLPKGVVISHKNIVLNAAAGTRVFARFKLNLNSDTVVISYLPLAHMFEQIGNFFAFYHGARVGYFRGKVTGLLDDMKVLKPNLFPVVPRLLNRLYDKVKSNLEKANPIARAIFNTAYKAKLNEMKKGIVRKNSIWDRLIFRKLQAELGGNVEIMVTGSAPIAPEVIELCRVTLGAQILEGYGQTECTALATITLPGDPSTGHVGAPATCCHVRLVDVPELEYWARDQKGEICVRGPSVTRGYFDDPEKTAEILDSEGWLHTGDVGMWLPNGTLKVIDRKKHIFKLAQGEYVAPEKIESVYVRAPIVQQVFVDGNSFERFLVAIVVPDEGSLRHWYKDHVINGVKPSMKEMCESDAARKYVLSEMQIVGKENGLNSIEQVKTIFLSAEQFTLENGLLTPTMKSKRPQLRKYYAAVMEKLYKTGAT